MVSPIDIQKALKGMDYPTTKQQILEHANGGDKELLDARGKIDDREYEWLSAVSAEVVE